MGLSFYSEAQKVWDNITRDVSVDNHDFDLAVHRKMFDIFHVGEYYYYVFDIKNLEFKFLSKGVEKVLGFPVEQVSIPFIMSLIHPDDQPVFLNHEAAMIDFAKSLDNEKLPKYKMSYDFRLRTSSGLYKRILQQVVSLKYDESNNLLYTFGVHTDISHLKKNNESILSFIGLDGEPSYIDVKPKEIYKPSTELFTPREREILLHILKGEQSQEIADKLFISKHTVNTHRKNILAKTNTKNTIELAIKIVTEGLI
ncbi:LuxR C-terminal-related transcriptional regulator [Flavobacterium selenitireducens]|uniref:LuxR C-terminal-related transcriptional regulator n=1 Tax=Flavobacterium selenitireducens TaxID=2722704 RepID=UPI001CC28FD8|nr:LuxR C-terminal-related transcriptional regulator [Flavobacterium selenitireducens]